MKMKRNEREVKGNEREMKGKWKGNENEGEREMERKLSDPSPFNNILNNIQFLLAVVGPRNGMLRHDLILEVDLVWRLSSTKNIL